MISPTQRPWLPHEHPGWKDYTLLFMQKLKRDVLLRKPFISHKGDMSELFAKSHISFQEKCERMAEYFIDSFFHYSRFQFCRTYFPGWPSEQGSESDAIEATARTLPMMAAWLHYQETTHGKTDSYGKRVRDALKKPFSVGPIRSIRDTGVKLKITINAFASAVILLWHCGWCVILSGKPIVQQSRNIFFAGFRA